MITGLITPEEQECLLSVKEHESVDLLAAELATWTLDVLGDVVMRLFTRLVAAQKSHDPHP